MGEEGSTHSDGWNVNANAPPPSSARPSDDQLRHPRHSPSSMMTTTTTAYEAPSSPTHSTGTMQHRRNTLSRPMIYTSTPDPTSALANPFEQGAGNGLGQGNHAGPSNGYGYGYAYGTHTGGQGGPSGPRSRGKHGDEDHTYGPPTIATGTSNKSRNRAGSSPYLPSHRRVSRQLSATSWSIRSLSKRPQQLRRWTIALFLLLIGLLAIHLWRRKYELQIEFSVFSKSWIKAEIDQIHPLRGCFSPPLLSPEYNLTKHLAPRRHSLSPGIALKRGMSCYDYSATIQPSPEVPLEHITYHTYWRADLLPFGERQAATLTAFLATQPLTHSSLVVWTNGADSLSQNQHIKPFLKTWGEYIQIRQVEMKDLTAGTQLASTLGHGENVFDQRGWVDGDAIRLLVLWQFGGIWMDMDELLTRDLHPLTESEWVTQWDCYDKPYFLLNGALMHFHQHSPYLCEAFHIMSSLPLPAPNTFTWGSHLYSKVHRALLAGGIKPFFVLPWCFADPRNCRTDNRLPDPFAADPPSFSGIKWGQGGREELERRVGQVWSVHLHNQWTKRFGKDGWVQRLLEGYAAQLDRLERYAGSMDMVKDGKVRFKRGQMGEGGEVMQTQGDIYEGWHHVDNQGGGQDESADT